jgi:hypothetical protein
MTIPLDMWTIYDHPLDFPNHFVARRWEVTEEARPTNQIMVAPTLAILRAMLPPGLTRILRDPRDEPAIVETWL